MSEPRQPSPSDLPETLLGVIVDEGRAVLQRRDAAALPAPLRPLARVDRRASASSTVRRQFAAALTRDAEFRAEVTAALLARADVARVLADWSRASAVAVVARAADADELSLVAAALWAATPDGWELGIGACAATEHERRARAALGDERDALEARVRALETDAREREARTAIHTAQVEEVTAKLAAERAARRQSEQRATEAADVVRADVAAAHDDAARARAELAALTARLAREQARVEELERALEDARTAPPSAPPIAASSSDVSARDLASLAGAAGELTRRLRDAATRADAATPTASSPTPSSPLPSAPATRTKPRLPAGLVADTVDGVRAMLSEGGATLVVDGYNVSKQAWPEATAAMQRDRLERGLQQVHQRFGCDVVCCYDGDDNIGVTRRRIPGVHVRFSARDQEADELVVDTVRSLPKRVPAVVASSDAWVREHAEALGSVVVSATTAAGVIAAAGRR